MLKLPKKIHQVWCGESSVPERDRVLAESFRRHAPDWELTLWAEHPELQEGPWEVKPLPPTHNRALVDVINTRAQGRHAAMADVYRLEVLNVEGGVYFDTDVMCVRNFDDVLQGVELGLSWEFGYGNIGNFFVASLPHHPALLRTFCEMSRRAQHINRRGRLLPPIATTGPLVVAEVFQSYQPHIFPHEVFSPWNPACVYENMESVPWPDMTRCVHLFDSKWTNLRRSPIDDPARGLEGAI